MTDALKSLVGKRIEIPTHYDAWMRGNRYGNVTAFRRGSAGKSDYVLVQMDGQTRRVKIWRMDAPYAKIIHTNTDPIGRNPRKRKLTLTSARGRRTPKPPRKTTKARKRAADKWVIRVVVGRSVWYLKPDKKTGARTKGDAWKTSFVGAQSFAKTHSFPRGAQVWIERY